MGIVTNNQGEKAIHGHTGNVVFYYAYGIQYVRAYVIPRNPNTEPQQKVRATFGAVSKLWKPLPEEEKSLYNRLAEGKPFSGYNLFVSMTLNGITPESLCTDLSEKISISFVHDSYIIRALTVYVSPLAGYAEKRAPHNAVMLKKPPGVLPMAS